MPTNEIKAFEGGTVFADPKAAVATMQASVIANALAFYAKTGMQMNRAYTFTPMMRTASQITGDKYKARDYAGAAADLKAWANAQAVLINVANAVAPQS